jgi:3-oxoacyl-[acyl-carrier protein] reductase
MVSLAGKVIVVTGTGSPLGGAVVRHVAALGARAVAVCSVQALAEANAEHIRAHGGEAIAFTGDVDTIEVIDRLVAESLAAFGRVDALIHIRTGLDGSDRGLGADPEGFLETVRIGIGGSFLLFRAFAAEFHRQGGGDLLTLTKSDPQSLALVAVSGALRELSRRVAEEYAGAGIRSNTIDLGTLDVPVSVPGESAPRVNLLGGGSAGAAAATPEEIAELFAYLVSADARYVSGANVAADGAAR